MLGQETGKSFEFCDMFINTWSDLFENTAWNDSFKWSTILILWPVSVFYCFVLPKKWLFCKTSWYLVLAKIFWIANVTYKMIPIPIHWYTWKLVYSHDVIDTNNNFHSLGIGENLPQILLRIEVALLNRYLNQNFKINNLFINIESWSTFVKLVSNSAL